MSHSVLRIIIDIVIIIIIIIIIQIIVSPASIISHSVLQIVITVISYTVKFLRRPQTRDPYIFETVPQPLLPFPVKTGEWAT